MFECWTCSFRKDNSYYHLCTYQKYDAFNNLPIANISFELEVLRPAVGASAKRHLAEDNWTLFVTGFMIRETSNITAYRTQLENI